MASIWLTLSEFQIAGAKMASTMAFAGKTSQGERADAASRSAILDSIHRLTGWLEKNDYRGYDTFDGLSAKFLRPLTFEKPVLRIVLQQSVRRLVINVRP